jgi:RNA 2',3'-cyclic 3'-phosphodiesterase
MRAFLAIEISDDIKQYLKTIIKSMAGKVDGVKWVNEEGQHITLKFFGEIEEARAWKIKEAVSMLEKKYSPFVATTKGLSAFPDKKRARVIVVTLEKGVDNIKMIFNDIEHGLSMLGIEKEKRELTPHITLGRRKIPAPLLDRDIIEMEEKTFIIDRLVLFKSTLTKEGPIYTPVWEIKLGGEEGEGRK